MLERREPVRPRSWITYRKCEQKLKRLHFQAKCPFFTISLNRRMLLFGASAPNTFADDTIQVLLTQNLFSCYLHLPVMPLVALGCNCGLVWLSCYRLETLMLHTGDGRQAWVMIWFQRAHTQGKKYCVQAPEILLSMVCLFPVKERKKEKGKKIVLITSACLRVKSRLRNEN